MQHLSLFAIQKGPRETKFSKGWQRLERLLMGGFSVHLVINETGEIQGVTVIKGNVDTCAKFIALFTIIRTDRNMLLACYSHKHISYRIRTIIRKAITKKLTGLLFGDKGYIKKDLFHELFDRGLKLVTSIKKGMKNSLMALNEKILLRKRSIIETVFGSLKNKFEIEHTRHRSPINFLVHIFSTLVSYSIQPLHF